MLLVAFFPGLLACSKLDEHLVLDKTYLFVADVLEFCQGGCNEKLDWESSTILIKGMVMDAGDDAAMLRNYQDDRFYISDIRNGMFMEVRVIGDKDEIFEILYGLNKKDMIFIEGTAESVIVNEGNECMKGVIIELAHPENIKINL